MTRAEHHAKAAELLARAETAALHLADSLTAQAQVHALLALAAPDVDAVVRRNRALGEAGGP